MLPGIPLVLQCPGCQRPVLLPTAASGNTFGARSWSDGKVVYPMRLETPALLLNADEDVLFWVHECQTLGSYDETLKQTWPNLNFARHPDLVHYVRALEDPRTADPEQVRYIRTNVMWTLNEPRRYSGEKIPLDAFERENLMALRECIKDDTSVHSQILSVEILRELSRFDEALAFLALIPVHDQLEPFLGLLSEHAEQRDPFVFELTLDSKPAREPRRRLVPPAWRTGSMMPPLERLAFYDRPEQAIVSARIADTTGLGDVDSKVLSLNVAPQDRILDAGSGVGRVALGLWELGFRNLAACDFAPAQHRMFIERAAQKGASIPHSLADLRALPYADGSFDAVVCLGNTFDEFDTNEERELVLRELARVTRKDGTFIHSRKCTPTSSEIDCLLQLPRLTLYPHWTAGLLNRDTVYLNPNPAEIEHLGFRIYGVSQRL